MRKLRALLAALVLLTVFAHPAIAADYVVVSTQILHNVTATSRFTDA